MTDVFVAATNFITGFLALHFTLIVNDITLWS